MKQKTNIKKELILPAIFYLIGIGLIVYWLIVGKTEMIINGVGIFLASIIPFVLRRFKVFIPLSLEVIFFLYAFFAVVLGSCFRLYDLWHPYDFILHFLFGYVGCMFGAYYLICNRAKMGSFVFLMIIGMFSMGCGAIWELIEFGCDQILGMNTQLAEQEGLMDTMLDIVANFGGVLIFFIHYLIDWKFRNRKFFFNLFQSFSRERHFSWNKEEKLEQ